MVITKVQEEVRQVLKETDELHNEIGRAIRHVNEEHRIGQFLKSRIVYFENYAAITQKMIDEVESNLSKSLRPAQELTYLENLESLVMHISSTYSDVETQDWQDTIELRLQNNNYILDSVVNRIVINATEKELASNLIEQVRICCYKFDLACEEVAKLAGKSSFVQDHPKKFPNIISYIPSEKHTEKLIPVSEVKPPAQKLEKESNESAKETNTLPGMRLKLKCSPAIAGFIVSELVRGDYIEIPLKHGTINYTELGRICSQIFELPSEYKITAVGWRKVIDVDSIGGNQLINSKRAKLKLPDRKDLE